MGVVSFWNKFVLFSNCRLGHITGHYLIAETGCRNDHVTKQYGHLYRLDLKVLVGPRDARFENVSVQVGLQGRNTRSLFAVN